jgi:hypothetical protein
MIAHAIDFPRFILYARKYAFENARIYLLLYLAIAAFLILLLGLYLNFTNPGLFSERAQVMYYFTTLFLSGCLSSGMLFSELGSKPKAISYLLVPSSSEEKFLTTLLFGVFVFFIMCSSVFYIINYVAVTIANFKYGTHWEVINLLSLNRYDNVFFDGPITDIFYLYFPIQALFLLCSVYFKKYSLFKAIVSVGLLWVLFVVLFLFFRFLMPPGRFADSINTYEVIEASGDNKLISIPPIIAYSTFIFFKFLVTPLLWATAYFRLKEKELN